jgi:hypothetical protein
MRTNTPLQALIILNDPTILESARVFSERLMQDGSSAEEKITTAFRSIVCRTPKAEEMKILMDYYESENKNFGGAPDKAKKFIKAGEYPYSNVTDVISLAALMQVVHTIYNMEESITKV